MKLSSDSCLWFATSADVFRYDLKTRSLKKYIYYNQKANINENITLATFFEDKKKRVWIGSANKGLGLYDNRQDSIKFLNTTNTNIIDNYILGINETPMGYLLLATNKGLSLFDVDKNTFYNYYNDFFPVRVTERKKRFYLQGR